MQQHHLLVTLVAVVVVLYGTASKFGAGCGKARGRTRFNHNRILRHTEAAGRSWLLDSGVCTLGHVVYVAWVAALLIHIGRPRRAGTIVLAVLLAATVVITAAMNPALAVRSTPAFIVVGGILTLVQHH